MLVQPYMLYVQDALIFAFGYRAVKAVSTMTHTYVRRIVDYSTAAAIRTITKIAGLTVLLSMLSSVFNVNPAALTVGSFGGLSMGLSHVVAGVFLLLSRSFKYESTVTILEKTGVVKEITLMHIVLETTDGENEIHIPNGSVVMQIIQRKKLLRLKLPLF